MTIKVLVCDDSALVRVLLTTVINARSDMTVVGCAPDALAAREMIKSLNPDVLTLDIEMPELDGLGVLREGAAHGEPDGVDEEHRQQREQQNG